jgi:hypothetical protein
MEIYNWIIAHLTGIGVIWLTVIKILTAWQDAVDAEPKGLKPPFGKIIYYMQAVSGYLFMGNRPQAITGGGK